MGACTMGLAIDELFFLLLEVSDIDKHLVLTEGLIHTTHSAYCARWYIYILHVGHYRIFYQYREMPTGHIGAKSTEKEGLLE